MKQNWIGKNLFRMAIPSLVIVLGILTGLKGFKIAEENSNKIFIISSRVSDSEILASAVQDEIRVIRHDPSEESSKSLLAKLQETLEDRKVQSIAMAFESQGQGAFNLASGQTVSLTQLLVNEEQQEFFRGLGKLVGPGGRIDILACDFSAGEYGEMLIDTIEDLAGVEVAASTNATGNSDERGDWNLETGNIDIASTYFNSESLSEYEGLLENPTMVKDINPGSGSSNPSNPKELNGILYFGAGDSINGRELWKSDGTPAGTILVKDINPGIGGSNIWIFAEMAGLLYFSADDGTHGLELWKSDGTFAGTTMVKDINPGSGGYDIWEILEMGGDLYFGANDGANGRELWKSDGTSGGTVMVKDIYPGSGGSGPGSLRAMGGILYFVANDGANGSELWRSDGTSGGTVMVKDINAGSGSSYPWYHSEIAGTLYFRADNGTSGTELWMSDGTSGGTVMVKDINPGSGGSYAWGFMQFDGSLYFNANDGTNGSELWKSDGTSGGTVMVRDINPGSGSSNPDRFAEYNGLLYFGASDGTNGYELWQSDGTSAGTIMVKDINAGSGSGVLWTGFTESNGALFFGANDGIHGPELWRSDGSSAGTFMVKDANPGIDSSIISSSFLTDVNGTLYYAGVENTHGTELWKYETDEIHDIFWVGLPDTLLAGSGAFPGDTVTIGICSGPPDILYHNGIYSFQTEIAYNDSLFQCIGYDSSGTILGNYGGLSPFTVQFRKDSGSGLSLDTLRIAAASDDSLYYPIVGGSVFGWVRPLIKLKFRIPPTAHNGDSTSLHFTRFMFNEGIPEAVTDDGSIKLRLRRLGDVDKNNAIQPYDAVLVLRHVIRDTTLDAESREAAEVSGNGEITAYDAALILMHYVGKITTFPAGDYYKNALPSNRGADIVMEWGEVKDGILSLMVNAKNLAEVYGYSFELSYDPSVLSYQGAGLTDWTKGMINAVKTEDGRIRFAAAGSEPIEGDGALAQISFRVKGDISGENLLQLTQLLLNEEAVISTASSVGIPKMYSLEQNYPNPFNPTTRIRYQIPDAANVQITIFNLLGQRVRTLVNEAQPAGAYDIMWDGTNDNGVRLASGVYVYRMKAGSFNQVRKLILMK